MDILSFLKCIILSVWYGFRTAKHYVRLMKYGDSLYRCKVMKRAALGMYVASVYLLSLHMHPHSEPCGAQYCSIGWCKIIQTFFRLLIINWTTIATCKSLLKWLTKVCCFRYIIIIVCFVVEIHNLNNLFILCQLVYLSVCHMPVFW